MKNKITLLNIGTSLIMQIVSIISAFIIPRLILTTFGSSSNGLISSISQFLSYISLIEGGITGVILANLYKPLVLGDTKRLSSILVTAKYFYQKIGIIFLGYSIVIGFIYPLVIDTGYNYWYVFILVLILSISLMLEYMFSITYTTLLNADKKVYLISITHSVLTIINIILTLVVVKFYPDIIILKLANVLLFALKPLVYKIYIKKYFSINWKVLRDNDLIKQRWNGFAINVAFFIHTSTDITLLTIFSDLKSISVYSIYFLVVSKISVLLHSITSGFQPVIGQTYAINDKKNLNEKMDLYEFIIIFIVGILFTMTGLLITPFVMIYTKEIIDANYYQPIFSIFLVLSEAIYLLRIPHVSLAYSANKFKEITIPAYIETIINIVISIILIKRIGLVGIAIGTLCGMIYRGVFHVYFTSKLLPSRPQKNFYKKMIIVLIPCILNIFICIYFFPFTEYTIKTWIVHAIIYGLICIINYLIICVVFFKKELIFIRNYIKK